MSVFSFSMSSRKFKRRKALSPICEEDRTYDESEGDSSRDDDKNPNVIHYCLSDKEYINKGWTVLPQHTFMKREKIFMPLDIKSSNDWICNNEGKAIIKYKSGETLAEFKNKSISRIFYKNGKIAIDINVFQINGHKFQRYVLRSEDNETLLAIVDTLGRGAVIDEFGKLRIKYNQLEGILLDNMVGTPRTWKWFQDSEKPELENVMFDTFIQPPDEDITQIIKREIKCNEEPGTSRRNAEKLGKKYDNTHDSDSNECRINRTARQFRNPSKNRPTFSSVDMDFKGSVSSDASIIKNVKVFHQQHIKPLTLKINNFLTFKVISRKNMYVMFLHDCWNMKIDVGVELTNECIESYLVQPDFASTDYEIVLSKINNFFHIKNKKIKSKLRLKQIK